MKTCFWIWTYELCPKPKELNAWLGMQGTCSRAENPMQVAFFGAFLRGRAFHCCFLLCQSEFWLVKYFCISWSRHFAAGLFAKGNLSVSHYWLNVYSHMHMMLFKFGGIHNCLQTILKGTTNKIKMVLFEEWKKPFSKSERLF